MVDATDKGHACLCGHWLPYVSFQLTPKGMLSMTAPCEKCGAPEGTRMAFNKKESAKRAPMLRELASLMRPKK